MADPGIFGVGCALPPHYAPQQRLTEALHDLWANESHRARRLEQLHRAVGVGGRYLAQPLEEYANIESFAHANRVWTEVAVALGEKAISAALTRAGLVPRDIDHVLFVTVTGIATPSIDARLVNRLGLRPDVKRTPIFGLGCVAGAAGLARAADILRAFPDEIALLLSVELCSLTLQRRDLSVANIIASGLFGDGAAAALLGGGSRPDRARPLILATRSVFYPGTERAMGWDVVETGFKLVLSADVPRLILQHLRGDVDSFLADHGLERARIRHWICHTGGPKVLESVETALALPSAALARSWRSLEAVGNISSASVLFVLRDMLEEGCAAPGDFGVLLAMGPGFSSELVLLGW